MIEVWKDIAGYEGLYMISNMGRVMSLERNTRYHKKPAQILKKQKTNCNYTKYNLSKFGKSKWPSAHRLVAEAFIPNPDNLKQVNHIDGNKSNNCVSNLEWCSASQNIVHAQKNGLFGAFRHNKAKMDRAGILAIREACALGYKRRDIANYFKVYKATIMCIANRKNYKYVV